MIESRSNLRAGRRPCDGTGRRRLMKRLIWTTAVIAASILAVAQSEDKGTVAGVEPISGRQLYSSYCALCHGADGKGGGPFSPQLKVWPIDLTQLAKKNHG